MDKMLNYKEMIKPFLFLLLLTSALLLLALLAYHCALSQWFQCLSL